MLPPPVLKDLGIAAGQRMSLQTTPDGRIVLARKPKYALRDMIAACDPKAAPPADLALWDRAKQTGQEVR